MSTSLTIEQIARIAQVSRSTVSRVLNNHPSVRPEVRDRVLQVISETQYTPHAAARSLASSRTNVIGLIIPRSATTIFMDPFFPQIIQGIAEATNREGYFLMLSMVTADLEQTFYHRIVRGRQFDGVIMLSSDIDDPILPLLIKDRIPLVLIGHHPYFQNLSAIDVENRDGARVAVTHLITLGHRRIATITGLLHMVVGLDRRDGYKQAMLESGLPIVPELMVEGEFSQEGGYRAMQQLLALPEPPTAVFSASDAMSIGALRAVAEAGLQVPRDLALVSFDDLPVAAFATPPLTTMHQPILEMGAAAVISLITQLENRTAAPQQIRLAAHLIVRQSCGGTP